MSSFIRTIESFGESVVLTDQDLSLGLKSYCYTNCNNDSPNELKEIRGMVFRDDELLFKPLGYTEETLYDLERFGDLTDWKLFPAYEGALIRVFCVDDKWFTSTHRKLDAFKSFWGGPTSYGENFKMGIEKQLGLALEDFYLSLNKSRVYLFLVLNNDNNRLVCVPTSGSTVFHVGTMFDVDKFDLDEYVGVDQPKELERNHNLFEILDNLGPEYQGVIAFPPSGLPIKFVTERYLSLRNVRGNEPNLKMRYLQVRNDPELSKNLRELFPKFCAIFDQCEEILNKVTKKIYHAYISRFIRKNFIVVPPPHWAIMKLCHEWHHQNRDENKISLEVVQKILNEQSAVHLYQILKTVQL